MISDFAGADKTVILASHLLVEVQKLCSDVAVLKEGKKIFDGAVSAILHQSDEIVIGTDDLQKLASVLEKYGGISTFRIEDQKVLLQLAEGSKLSELTAHLIKNGININHISEYVGNLEKEFIKLLGEGQ
jgi:ABC-2 type transport system ATP-binding protein